MNMIILVGLLISMASYWVLVYKINYNYGTISSSSKNGTLNLEYWDGQTLFMKIFKFPTNHYISHNGNITKIAGNNDKLVFKSTVDGIEVERQDKILLKIMY